MISKNEDKLQNGDIRPTSPENFHKFSVQFSYLFKGSKMASDDGICTFMEPPSDSEISDLDPLDVDSIADLSVCSFSLLLCREISWFKSS